VIQVNVADLNDKRFGSELVFEKNEGMSSPLSRIYHQSCGTYTDPYNMGRSKIYNQSFQRANFMSGINLTPNS
jgi:hypothetical protein